MFPDHLNDFIDSLNDDGLDPAAFGEELQSYLSQANIGNNNSSNSSISAWFDSATVDQNQTKHCVPNDFSFSDQASEHLAQEKLVEDVVFEEAPSPIPNRPPKKRSRVRPPSQTHAHIMAERRRREQLSQLFIALSALIPGLKKMDKSSVLEDAIKYMKQLQERVNKLEEMTEKRSMESVIIVKKSQILVQDNEAQDEENDECNGVEERRLPEIEARVCESHMLLRVQCEKHKGILVKLLSKIESLGMIIVNTNATQFGDVVLDINIVAELEKEFDLTTNEVVTVVREALR